MAPASVKKTTSDDMEVSGTTVKSLHILPSMLGEKFPQLPDSPHITLTHDLTSDVISSCHNIQSPNRKRVRHLLSSVSGCPTQIHCSPLSPNTSGSISSTIHPLSPKDGASSVANQYPYSVLQTAQLDGYAMECNDVSWNEIEYFLDPSSKTTDQTSQIETSTDLLVAEDCSKKNNWEDWSELITVNDDSLDANWSDLLVDSNPPEPDPKVELPSLPFSLFCCSMSTFFILVRGSHCELNTYDLCILLINFR